MATLTVTATHNFTGENLGPDPIDEIEFTNPAGTAFASFEGDQFGTGNGLIASNVLLTGSTGTNVIEVNAITGTFSAAAWQFSNWDAVDQISLRGTNASETITGSSKNDIIRDDDGADNLNGGVGDDQFVASFADIAAGEIIDGGDDIDTLRLEGANFDLTLAGTTVTNVEILEFQFSSSLIASGGHFGGAGDFTTVTGNAPFAQSLTVNGNIVDLSGIGFTNWDGANQTITINGISASANNLVGSSKKDSINGGDGVDTMEGEGGVDDLDGGDGDDAFVYDNPADAASGEHLDGGVGTDRISIQFATAITADFSAMTLENIEVLEFLGSTVFGGRTAVLSGTQIGSETITTVNGDAFTRENLVVNAASDVDLSGVTFNNWTTTSNLSLHTITINGTAAAENLTGSSQIDTINAGDGNDVLTGGADNDGLNGGLGNDTAVFSGNRSSYTLQVVANTIVLSGLDGTDTLTSIERLQFADGTVELVNDGSALFDTLFYLSQNPDVFQFGVDALFHFNVVGFHEGRDPNAFFDTSGYLAVNPDVAASGVNPLDHFHQFGWKQGRDPSADFDTTLYLINNPDVAAAHIDPLEHFLQFGISEGRQAFAAIGQSIVGGFDAEFYLFHNPDVAAAGVDPRFHYDVAGQFEGRNPNAWFDTAGYLSNYRDVAAAGINPLSHYETVGWTEGRDPSAGFDTLGYLAANPDVAAANINPLDHFLNFGIYEGRTAVNDGVFF